MNNFVLEILFKKVAKLFDIIFLSILSPDFFDEANVALNIYSVSIITLYKRRICINYSWIANASASASAFLF